MRVRTCAAALVAVLAATGCGSDSPDRPAPGLTAAQARSLEAPLQQARTTTAARDLGGTLRHLKAFRTRVVRLRRAGAIDAATARRMRIGAARAEARARSELAPPPVVAPEPAPPAEPVKPRKGKKAKKGKRGRGEGRWGGDEEGDD